MRTILIPTLVQGVATAFFFVPMITITMSAQISEFVNQGSPATNSALAGLAGAGLTPDQALATINRLADQQAYMLAANDVFTHRRLFSCCSFRWCI